MLRDCDDFADFLRQRGCVVIPREPLRNPVGVGALMYDLPRVAATRQPWAMLRSPFGAGRNENSKPNLYCGNINPESGKSLSLVPKLQLGNKRNEACPGSDGK